MGFAGHLQYFSPKAPADSEEAVSRLLDLMPYKKLRSASRFRDRTRFFLELAQGTVSIDDEPDEEYESVLTPTREQAVALLHTHKNWSLSVRSIDRVDPELAAAITSIDPCIRGDWSIGTYAYRIEAGPHECMEDASEIKYFGHAEISVTFDGHGSPNDWAS